MIRPQKYLSPDGITIFKRIVKHLRDNNIEDGINTYEISMLANSIDLYATCSAWCNENGHTQASQSGYEQVHPKYTIMNKEYASITKHSLKFGLNPMDLKKLLESAPPKEEEEDDLFKLLK